jgi:hypothetical protein
LIEQKRKFNTYLDKKSDLINQDFLNTSEDRAKANRSMMKNPLPLFDSEMDLHNNGHMITKQIPIKLQPLTPKKDKSSIDI